MFVLMGTACDMCVRPVWLALYLEGGCEESVIHTGRYNTGLFRSYKVLAAAAATGARAAVRGDTASGCLRVPGLGRAPSGVRARAQVGVVPAAAPRCLCPGRGPAAARGEVQAEAGYRGDPESPRKDRGPSRSHG